MAPLFVVVALAAVVCLAVVLMRRTRPVSVFEERLALLDRLLGQHGIDADIYIDARPVEIVVRNTGAPDGALMFDASGAVPEALTRLSMRAIPIARGGLVHFAIHEDGVERWTDADVERVAADVVLVVDALCRRPSPQTPPIPPAPPADADAEGLAEGSGESSSSVPIACAKGT